MGINQGGTVTDTVTGSIEVGGLSVKVAGLHLCLKNLNESIDALGKSSVFNKAAMAERVLSDARDFMVQSAEITLEFSGELNLINSQLARINGVMGFVNGK